MEYNISVANNLRMLLPELSQQIMIKSCRPLTIFEIAQEAGIPHLLVVGGIIEGKFHPLDQPVEQESQIVLLGPVAGG